MKYMLLVALLGMVAFVHSAPQSDADATIVQSANDNPGNGEFNWNFETSNKIQSSANGQLRDGPLEDGTNGQFQVVEGSYSYTSPDGRLITVTYTSDEKGYRAKTTYA